MDRKRLYHDNFVELMLEGDTYVVVKKQPKVKVTHRSIKDDVKLMQSTDTVKTFLPRFNMVHSVFNCPSVNGTLIFFTTDGDPLRYCCGKHELFSRDFEELVNIAAKEYNAESWIYGMAYRDYAPETGYILLLKKKESLNMEKDDFAYHLAIKTDNPKITFHYFRPLKRKDSYGEYIDYDVLESKFCKKYKVNQNNLIRLETNCGYNGDYAYLELKSWKIVPGSAYSKR